MSAQYKVSDLIPHMTRIIVEMYEDTRNAVSINMMGTVDAPDTVETLRSAFVAACNARDSRARIPYFPVWTGACENTVWGSPEANQMFRFVHDITAHCIGGLSFSDTDEIAAGDLFARAVWHKAKDFGFDDALAGLCSALAYLDTAGQIIYKQVHGRFPDNQLQFAEEVWEGYTYQLSHGFCTTLECAERAIRRYAR